METILYINYMKHNSIYRRFSHKINYKALIQY